jgi:hypothetical protein
VHKENNRPVGENLPNLVTLLGGWVSSDASALTTLQPNKLSNHKQDITYNGRKELILINTLCRNDLILINKLYNVVKRPQMGFDDFIHFTSSEYTVLSSDKT